MQGEGEEEPNRKREIVVRGQRRKGGTMQREGGVTKQKGRDGCKGSEEERRNHAGKGRWL